MRARAPEGASRTRIQQEFPVSLTRDQVQQIAVLARLKVDDDQFAETVDKLSRIVDFVDQLAQADTSDVIPMAHPLDVAQRLRSDEVTEPNERDRVQENAPSTQRFWPVI